MVVLNKIYTRTGDAGDTGLATGERVKKFDPRVDAYGEVDEANACLGLARLHTVGDDVLDPMLARIQNELFDLGADLATPERDGKALGWEPLRIVQSQVDRLEADIDRLNDELAPLTSFILPAGSPAASYLHLARTVCRRAERVATRLAVQDGEKVSPEALKYLNRLSDLLFVMARYANGKGSAEVLWRPGATR
jgi:cob(I)alamin adenosyltransferase